MRSIINLLIAAAIYLCLTMAHLQPFNAQSLDRNALLTALQQQVEQIGMVKEQITNMEEELARFHAKESASERVPLLLKEMIKWDGSGEEVEATAKLWVAMEKALEGWKVVEERKDAKTFGEVEGSEIVEGE